MYVSRNMNGRTNIVICVGGYLGISVFGTLFIPMVHAEGFVMDPRWGHASTYIPKPPTLIIQGGKTDTSSSYTYASSPNSADLISISLTTSFSTSSPPATLLNSTATPPYAWHTLSTFSSDSTSSSILSFGGNGGPLEAVQTQADSAWLFDIASSGGNTYTQEGTAWGGQPMRRIYHSAASSGSDGGKVYITGGLKDDGSGQVFSEVYSFDPSSSTFTSLPPLPTGTYHHSSILLPNGTLVIMGGALLSPETGNPALQSLSSVYTLDTTANAPIWLTQSTGGSPPSDRRGQTIALNGDGTKAFLFGGANVGLDEVYGDGWELDLGSSTWIQAAEGKTGGPSARFDHSAVAVGDGKIMVFGGESSPRCVLKKQADDAGSGYGSTGPADSSLYIWDTASNSWQTSFEPAGTPGSGSTGVTNAVPGASSRTLAGPQSTAQPTAITTAGKPGASPSDAQQSVDSLASSTAASIRSSASPSQNPDHSAGIFTTPVRIGIILGILALAGMAAAGALLAYRRRRRRPRQMGAAGWYPSDPRSGPPNQPYGSREKGGEGLIAAQSGRKEVWDEPEVISEEPVIGLGMGAIGASLAGISSKLGSKRPIHDAYAEIGEEGSSTRGGPLRKSTRKVGNGIRLVGPRSPTTSSTNRFAPIRMGGGRSRGSIRDSRVDMLGEEDSRRFNPIKEEDWVVPEDESDNGWKSAESLLGRERRRERSGLSDPFDDDEDSLHPPMRGGPVPTPRDSRLDLDPFDDFSQQDPDAQPISGQYILPPFSPDLATLLPPPAMTRGYSDNSIPRSQRSGQSTTASDAEEGIIHHAHYISTDTPAYISPVETSYEPIKRSASFFQRMAAGGIASLLSRPSVSRPRNALNIRDPAPVPTLWPVLSRDEEDSGSGTPHPPTSFRDPTSSLAALGLPTHGHSEGPSLSSLQSAKSMRDMVIIQRETSISTIETEAIIETAASTPDPSISDSVRDVLEDGDGDIRAGGHRRHGVTAITDSPTSTVYAHQRHGMTGGETPGSVVFNGADFASPALFPPVPSTTTQTQATRPTLTRNPSLNVPSPSPIPTRPLSPQITPTKRPASIPEGSPVPTPLLSHRRPVRDVVNSINKRGGSVPGPSPNASLFSPVSQYSPAPGSSRPSSMTYEAVKRSPLTVTNPDWRKGSSSSR